MAETAHPGDGETRRDFLTLTASAVAAVGAASAMWPFLGSLNPAKDTLAQLTTEVDLSPVQVGQRITVTWRGKPVFIDHRTEEEIKQAQDVPLGDLVDPQLGGQPHTPQRRERVVEPRDDGAAGGRWQVGADAQLPAGLAGGADGQLGR
jgi:ubiquinol-cytochrome c reductase iron-sulfur subunit